MYKDLSFILCGDTFGHMIPKVVREKLEQYLKYTSSSSLPTTPSYVSFHAMMRNHLVRAASLITVPKQVGY